MAGNLVACALLALPASAFATFTLDGGVESASGMLQGRRVVEYRCTQTSHNDVPVDIHIGILDPVGTVIAGPVDCEDVPDGASCTVVHPVVWPALDQSAWCHSVVVRSDEVAAPLELRGNFVGLDRNGKTQVEEDLVAAGPRLTADDAPEEHYTGVVGGPRNGMLSCELVHLGLGTLDGAELALYEPDGSLLAGPLACDPIDTLSACRLHHAIAWPSNEVHAYCGAVVPAGASVVGNLGYKDTTNLTQASSPLEESIGVCPIPLPAEICDGLDNDCNGLADVQGVGSETDDDGDGQSECQGDCDDSASSNFAGNAEICDGLDNDCNGLADVQGPGSETDDDGDGLSECQGDCDDTNADVNPGAIEICNGGVDDDCNALTIEGADFDGDGADTCLPDCDDTDSERFPGNTETCDDGKDNDCNELVDCDDPQCAASPSCQLAVDDTATVLEDDPPTPINVLANDTGAGGTPISAVTQPANGSVIPTGGGSGLTYQPDPDYCNDGVPTDDFTYTLSPSGSVADVRMTVTCVNDPPD